MYTPLSPSNPNFTISTSSYQPDNSKMELVKKLIKEDKITMEEAFILLSGNVTYNYTTPRNQHPYTLTGAY